jgi:hypothetical protein
MSIVGVVRELLVRYLDVWTPTALHARRSAFAVAGPAGSELAEAALSVFAEFSDRMRGRQLALIVVAPDVDGLAQRLAAAQADLGTPADLSVHPVAGGPEDRLVPALRAAGVAKAPLLALVDAPQPPPEDVTREVRAARPAELLLLTAPGSWPACRAALRGAGFPLTAGVELVDTAGANADARLLAFATSHDKSLEAFKNAMWAVDEYAGVRFRDPADPDEHLLDISLKPHPGPLRRALLAHLGSTGGCTVTELRRHTLTDTVYRSSDTTSALTSLLTAGAVTRSPATGRLAGDVRIAPAGSRPA